MSKDQQELV